MQQFEDSQACMGGAADVLLEEQCVQGASTPLSIPLVAMALAGRLTDTSLANQRICPDTFGLPRTPCASKWPCASKVPCAL